MTAIACAYACSPSPVASSRWAALRAVRSRSAKQAPGRGSGRYSSQRRAPSSPNGRAASSRPGPSSAASSAVPAARIAAATAAVMAPVYQPGIRGPG